MKSTIKIHVAGQQYVLRSDADEVYVQSLAEFVNTRINALKGNRQVATQSDVVLAALKLADELQRERQLQTQLRTQVKERVSAMLDRLNLDTDRGDEASGLAAANNRKAVQKSLESRSRRGKGSK